MAWKTVRLGDVCKITRRNVTPKSQSYYNLYSLPAFDNNKTAEYVNGDTIKSNKLALLPNTILFNKLNVKFKRVWNIHNIPTAENICSSEFIPLQVSDGVEQDYLYYLLISDSFTKRITAFSAGTSSSHQRISTDSLMSFDISLPPPRAETDSGDFIVVG